MTPVDMIFLVLTFVLITIAFRWLMKLKRQVREDRIRSEEVMLEIDERMARMHIK